MFPLVPPISQMGKESRKWMCVLATAPRKGTLLWLTITTFPLDHYDNICDNNLWKIFAYLEKPQSQRTVQNVQKHLPSIIFCRYQYKNQKEFLPKWHFVNANFSHDGLCDPILPQEDKIKLHPSDSLRHMTLINKEEKKRFLLSKITSQSFKVKKENLMLDSHATCLVKEMETLQQFLTQIGIMLE